MLTGKVKFFNDEKGFGFITPDAGGSEVFVHVSEVEKGTLTSDENVSYEMGESRRGPCAVQVKSL